MSKFTIWVLMESEATDYRYRRTISMAQQRALEDGIAQSNLGMVNTRALLGALAWMAVWMPGLYDYGSHYFNIGPQEAVIGNGGFSAPHHHPWSDLQDIKSACKLDDAS